MIRKYFHKLKHSNKDKINWRSHEPTRIEAFSDGVFAFATSLLIISLEVPKNSKELLESLEGFFPFMFCFTGLFFVWYWQYVFFRRFGMHDKGTIFLNACLIFIVLFLMYPLKFMFSSMILRDLYTISLEDVAPLCIFYNGAFGMVFLLFTLMYSNAYFKREELRLSPIEVFETSSYILDQFVCSCVAFSAALIAFLQRHNDANHIQYCFIAYACMGVIMPIIGKIRDRQFKKRFGNALMVEPHHGTEG